VLSASLEKQFKYENEQSGRQNGARKFQIGPSIQCNPNRNSWINLVCLFGCTRESPAVEGFVFIGHNFARAAGGRSLNRPPLTLTSQRAWLATPAQPAMTGGPPERFPEHPTDGPPQPCPSLLKAPWPSFAVAAMPLV
jgi:hypothetical protein